MDPREESRQIDKLCDQWEQLIRNGEEYSPGSFLESIPESSRKELFLELLLVERDLVERSVFEQRLEKYRIDHAQYVPVIEQLTLIGEPPEELPPKDYANPTASIESIGPYKIIEPIGEGGMGTVYLAQQMEPVKRRVAVKVIKLGLDSKQVVARFEAERQALAMMDHPCIAKILDAGTTELGQPFFAMELVDGLPLNQYCDQQRLTIKDRLNVFCQICEAVQHAHQKGIIHRDLKPTNILVTEFNGKPLPKIIDFGLAKALETTEKLTDMTVFTEFGQVVGTLKYMSPEQAGLDALDIDTRSDIYTLGVILYQLLTGSTPIDDESIRNRAMMQVLELVRKQDAKRPSSRLSTLNETVTAITDRRQIDPRKLAQILAGDLDWIVMKAIEKDRNRRYQSAVGLGSDIRRFIAGEPVEARPPSATYQLRKFVKRNTGLVAATLISTTLLIAGIIGTSIGFYRAGALAKQNEEKANQLQLIVDFQKDRLSTLDPEEIGAKLFQDVVNRVESSDADELQRMLASVNFTTAAKDFIYENIFANALDAIETDFAAQPLLSAQLLETSGRTMSDLGIFDRATKPLAKALELYRETIGTDSREWIGVLDHLGNLYVEMGQLEKGKQMLTQALDARQQHLPDDIEGVLLSKNNLASLSLAEGNYSEAEQTYQSVLDNAIQEFGVEDYRTATAYANVGLAQSKLSKFDVAEENLKIALDLRKKLLGTSDPKYLTSLTNIGTLKLRRRQFAEAIEFLNESVALHRKTLGEDHPSTLLVANNLGVCLGNLNRFDESEELLKSVLSKRQKVLGNYHVHTASTMCNLGFVYYQMKKFGSALEHIEQAINAANNSVGYCHPETVTFIKNFAGIATESKNFADIARVLAPYEELNEEDLRKIPPFIRAELLVELGKARLQLGSVEESRKSERCLKEVLGLLPESHPTVKAAKKTLIALYEKWHQLDSRGGYLEKAEAIRTELNQ